MTVRIKKLCKNVDIRDYLERELQSANCSLIPPSVLSYILSKIRQTSTIHPSHLSAKDDDSSFNTECFFLFSQKGSRCIPLLL